MEIILTSTVQQTDFSLIASAIFNVIIASWLLQKLYMNINLDICTDISLNVGQTLADIFDPYKLELYLSMKRFSSLIKQTYDIFEKIWIGKIYPQLETGIIHPDLADLKIMFQHLIFSHETIITQTNIFYKVFSNLENPAFIRNYPKYFQIVEELNNNKQDMMLQNQKYMDMLLDLLEPLQAIWN